MLRSVLATLLVKFYKQRVNGYHEGLQKVLSKFRAPKGFRMAKTPYDLLGDIRSSVEDILAKMLSLKKEGKGRMELKELLTEASVMFVELRQVNRLILQEEDRVKADTESAKTPVDHTTLQLHNLLYEKNYYLKAIKACKDFKSKYPDIDMVPEEEFFRDAPDELKSDPTLKEDAHKLMLQRLNFELHQRKDLCKHQDLLEVRKKLLQESIANRRKFLSSLPSHLKALKKASLPVQQQLGILHTKRAKQHQLADLLPPPLYILYSQLLSQKEAFGEAIELEILGSAKDAQALARHQANKEANIGGGSDETKPEEDAPEDDDDSQRRRKRVKKSNEKQNQDGMGAYHAHPLTIVLQIFDSDNMGNTDKTIKLLTVVFEFLPRLHVICAGLDSATQAGASNLLANLFPDDTGLDLPNQVSKLQAGGDFVYDEKRPLRPFKWAQYLAGIDFLPEAPTLFQDTGMPVDSSKGCVLSSGLAMYRQQHRVLAVLQQLRSRQKAQLALKEQLEALAKLNRPVMKSKSLPWVVHNSKSTLTSWIEVESPGHDHSSSLSTVVGGSLHLSSAGQSTKVGVVTIFATSEVEAGREDGELPSSTPLLLTAGPGSTNSKPTTGRDIGHEVAPGTSSLLSTKDVIGSSSKSSSGERRPRREKASSASLSVQREEVGLVGLGALHVPGLDALMEEGMDGLESDRYVEATVEDDKSAGKGKRGWQECGVQRYRTIIQRESGPSGKCLDLEAQVVISLEYPVRPPQFCLRSMSARSEPPVLPTGPPGLLDVTETLVLGEGKIDEWFNELRAIEAEVNIHVPEMLSRAEQNYTLSHQVAALMMLYDLQIDSDISMQGSQPSGCNFGILDYLGGKVGSRYLRGRDRRRPLAWNREQCIFEHRLT